MELSEINVVKKRRYELSVALLFPSTYRASLSSLALQILYFYLNSFPEVFAERVVSDVKGGVMSIETSKPLAKFDVIMVSAYHELDYPSAVSMLAKGGVSPLRAKREKPLVIWGGPLPTANPWPLYELADAVLVGEAEAFLESFVERALEASNRRELLDSIAEIREAWIPELKEKSAVGRVEDLDRAFFPVMQLQSLRVEPYLGRAFLVEPSRGCARGCRFCMEAAILGPRRERSLSKLVEYIEEGVEVNRVDKVAFYTLSFFDSELGVRLLEYLVSKSLKGSIPSVRADSLDEYKVELVKAVGQRVLTIAPETPCPRLQRLINKTIPTETVLEVAKWCKKHGLSIKLYYMYGLPGEEEEDLRKIAEQVRAVRDVLGEKGRVRVSIVPFTPKPATLMWREKMLDLRELKKRERELKRLISPLARVESYPPKLSRLQYEMNALGKEAFRLILKLASSKEEPGGLALASESLGGLEEIG